MNDSIIEIPYPNKYWALKPAENTKCSCKHVICYTTSIDGKRSCNTLGCPYDISGDDGYF